MRKLISIILMILTIWQCNVYAQEPECELPTINPRHLDFTDTKGGEPLVTHTFSNKKIMVLRFDEIEQLDIILSGY